MKLNKFTYFQPPTQTPTREWEGGEIPPLRLAGIPPEPLPPEVELSPVRAPEVRLRPAVDTKAPRKGLWTQLLLLLLVGSLCVTAYYVISRYVITPVIIQGRSMAPTLKDGECYMLNRWVYLFESPKRGDLVVIQDPGHNDFAVKRIVAKPGDWVNLRDGQVFLNGRRLDEPYLPKGVRTFAPDLHEKWVQLGENQYYVLGDNRSNSEDSRYYGRISRHAIVGQIAP